MFDTELCPLPFSMEEMFGFISCRFTGYPSSVQEQALLWLHVSVLSLSHAEAAYDFGKERKKTKKQQGEKKKSLFQAPWNLSALCLAPV